VRISWTRLRPSASVAATNSIVSLFGLQVRGARGEARVEIELRDDRLHLVNELAAPLVAEIVEEDMEHALGGSVERTLLQETLA